MAGVSPASPRSASPAIGLVATLLAGAQSYRSAGIHTYCWQLLRHLPQAFAAARFTGYGGAPAPEANLRWRRAPLPLRHPLARILWEQAALPLLLAQDRPGAPARFRLCPALADADAGHCHRARSQFSALSRRVPPCQSPLSLPHHRGQLPAGRGA